MLDLIGKYVLIRAKGAGVFTGTLSELDIEKAIVVLSNARRIWYWDGAASLSELAQRGTSKPALCKFPVEVSRVTVFNVLEVIEVSEEAEKSIKDVPIWTAKTAKAA
jgi:hypothetical protein